MITFTIIYGAVWRMVDGRSWRPNNWNIGLFVGLLLLCLFKFESVPISLTVAAIAAINILSGYKMFTWPWVVYGMGITLNKLLFKFFNQSIYETLIFKGQIKEAYEKNNGYHTWHTTYRFLVPALAICALTSFNLYWLLAVAASGALFPLSLKVLAFVPVQHRDFVGEAFAYIREGILGAVVFAMVIL